MRTRLLAAVALLTLLDARATFADVVLDWNNVTLNAIRTDKTPPPKASRALAIVHVAVYDAVIGIVGGFELYLATASAPPGSSAEAAGAAAAHKALVAIFPAQQATFDAALVTSLAAIPDGAPETNGVAFGESVATAVLAARANDHAGDVVTPSFPLGSGWWEKTPPAFADPLLPNWPRVTPWVLSHGSDLRPAAPPPPNTSTYTASFNEVKNLGRATSAARTAEQTQIALFWADGSGTSTPPGHWNLIAQSLSASQHLGLAQNARLFALLGLAQADAAIAAWDAKYAYSCWRPVTAIVDADDDGNPATAADVAWTSLIATPPFPTYTSGHSTFSGAASRVLALYFGADAIPFSATSEGLPGVTRQFTSFSQAANEAGQSRIYGGIHFQFDNQAGLAAGRAIGERTAFVRLLPVEAPSACATSSTTACVEGDRFRVRASWATNDASGNAQLTSGTDNAAYFSFFDPDNTELVVKVLNACNGYDRFWVFAGGLTDVEVRLTVTDTHTGRTRQYFNPRGKAFAPVQDVSAFATCP